VFATVFCNSCRMTSKQKNFQMQNYSIFRKKLLCNFPWQDFPLTIPQLSLISLTFPWHLYNSLTFPGFSDNWPPRIQELEWNVWIWVRYSEVPLFLTLRTLTFGIPNLQNSGLVTNVWAVLPVTIVEHDFFNERKDDQLYDDPVKRWQFSTKAAPTPLHHNKWHIHEWNANQGLVHHHHQHNVL